MEGIIEGIERIHNIPFESWFDFYYSQNYLDPHTHPLPLLIYHLPPREPGPNTFSVRIKQFTDSLPLFLVEATSSVGKLHSWVT